MREVLRDRNIAAILLATLLLGIGYGISIALTALHLDAHQFTKIQIGSLASWFAGGLVAFSLPMGHIVRRATPKRVLVAALFGYAVIVTLFPHLRAFSAIAAARFLDGAFSVGVWVASETALLARADRRRKAFVMSLYSIAIAVGYVVGPGVARVLAPIMPVTFAFALSGVLATAAAIVCIVRLEASLVHEEKDEEKDEPSPGSAQGASSTAPVATAGDILRRIRTSCFASFSYGYFQSSTVLFLPLFLIQSKGIAREQTILVPAFFAAGMLLCTTIAGRIGDALGHLLSMRVLGCIGACTVLAFTLLDSFAAMAVAIFVAGATLACISPLSLALQGLVLRPAELSRGNGIYNAFYASGMLLGPRISSELFERFGGPVMLFHIAALWAAFVAYTLIHRRDDPRTRGPHTASHANEANRIDFEAGAPPSADVESSA